MKDKRFIELVNLYIDRQISEEETADLETEMQNNPRRRAIYHQYCQMHRATTLVYESFRNEDSAAKAQANGQPAAIARFQTPRRTVNNHWSYYVAGIAAACVALVFVRSTSVNTAETAVPHAPFQTASAAAPVSASMPIALAGSSGESVAVAAPAHRDEPKQNYSVMLANLRTQETRAFASGQIQNRRSSLFEDGIFDSQPTFPTVNQRVFVGKQAPEQAVEFTAFQFQR